ncbi:hypothetical protein EDD11_001267 [Mortierella claussenii]|nr:hypothetical protein EDD11_001267 [Mortierella claussenii]
MSSSRDESDSRTNSVYVDAPEIPADDIVGQSLDSFFSANSPTTAEATAVVTAVAPFAAPSPQSFHPANTDHDDSQASSEEEEGDQQAGAEGEGSEQDEQGSANSPEEGQQSLRGAINQRGRASLSSPSDQTSRHAEDDEDEDDEEFVMQVDPATGLHRATSRSRSSVRARSTSLTNRLRRQHQRMTSATRSNPAARSGSSRASASGTNGSTSGASSSRPATTASAVPVVDEKAQSELRKKIMDIQRDPAIGFAEKASKIQKLMSSNWQGTVKASEKQPADMSNETTEEDLKATYHNKEKNTLGCKHYARGCKLKANCCGRWFNCRFCHDDVCDHAIVRSETKTMLCMHCKAIQPAAQSCTSCNTQLARYFCDICKLWDDDRAKAIYHCADCGICRIGKGLGQDFFHCKKCNICMNIQLLDNHKCIERNLECDCPICGEYMFTSTTTVIFMCHDEYVKTSYQCPTCWKALGDMSIYYKKIDSLLAEQTMPPEYANILSIVLCNDCEVKSEAPYHFLYHKCDKCKGYNTKVLETFMRAQDGQVQLVENATATGASGTIPENNLSGSSNSSSTADGNAAGDMGFAAGSSSNSAP